MGGHFASFVILNEMNDLLCLDLQSGQVFSRRYFAIAQYDKLVVYFVSKSQITDRSRPHLLNLETDGHFYTNHVFCFFFLAAGKSTLFKISR